MNNDTIETKEKVIGDFKPKRTFLNFISAIKSKKVRLLRNIAFIKGEKLSGILEGTIFKITICDEGTIKFEEESTNNSNKEMIQRFIDEIDQSNTSGYAEKYIVSGLEFTDEDGNLCYLEVEKDKPIDRLKTLIDDATEKRKVSDKGLSILDMLFPDEDDNINVEHTTEELESVSSNQYSSYIEESIKKMNDEKVLELKSRVDEKQIEIKKEKYNVRQSETKIEDLNTQLRILESRLESLKPIEDPNGYVFHLSEQKKHGLELDETTKKVADKIADIMKLKKDVLFDLLTSGFYTIKVVKKTDDYSKTIELDSKTEEELEEIDREKIELSNIKQTILNIDLDGKFTLDENDDLEYRGNLNWHQIVNKLIKKGFQQDPNFDDFCSEK